MKNSFVRVTFKSDYIFYILYIREAFSISATDRKKSRRRQRITLISTKSQELSPLRFDRCELFCSLPQVLGVNALGHVTTVSALVFSGCRGGLMGCEQPAPLPSSGLGITVLTTSQTALPSRFTSTTTRETEN